MPTPTSGRTKVGKCPLSSIKDKNNKYVRKVRIGDKCVNPTPANQRAAYDYQKKQDKLAQNKARGAAATAKAVDAERKKAQARGVRLG